MPHVPCPNPDTAACGSSNAAFRYDDGHLFCHKCGYRENARDPDMVTEAPAVQRRKGPVSFVDAECKDIVSRGLRADTCLKWGYGIGKHRGKTVHVAEYRDPKGSVCGQKIRTKTKDFEVIGDLKPAGLYGQWLWRDEGRIVVVVEGEIDALSVSQIQGNKWPVVSLPNGAGSAKKAVGASREWLERFDKVVLMLDNDPVGEAAAIEAAEALTPGKAWIARLPLKDANEMLLADRGKEVIDAIFGCKQYRPDTLVTGDDIWSFITREDLAYSAPVFHAGLQAKLRGLRVGETTTIAAGTGTGKSTFCRELAAALIQGGERVGYVALEENVRQSALGILSVLKDQRLYLQQNSQFVTPELKALLDSFKDRVVFYDHWGSLESDSLLAKIRFMAQAQGVRFVVLDHLSIVVSGMDLEGDERRALDSTMTAISSMAQNLGVHVVLVVHLKRTDGKPHEEGKPVTLQDLRGSHAIAQLSHNVVSLERDQQGGDGITTVRVLKCRLVGDLGEAGHLKWDPTTGRLKEFVNGFKDETFEATTV